MHHYRHIFDGISMIHWKSHYQLSQLSYLILVKNPEILPEMAEITAHTDNRVVIAL
jgi:hypothetical protein